MASEGMNIPTLNMVLLATPKSNIEQSVGRILRLKKEERTVQPMILDVVDVAFDGCAGQWNKRRKFYTECGYILRWKGESSEISETTEDAAPTGVPLFVESSDDEAPAPASAPKAERVKKSRKKKSSDAADIISHVTRGNAMFVDSD
jgi:superfamily II DNA or RNA helicase